MDVVLRAGVQVAQLDPLVIISAMAVSHCVRRQDVEDAETYMTGSDRVLVVWRDRERDLHPTLRARTHIQLARPLD